MIIRKQDHTLCPTKSLGLKISASCLRPRVLALITPVLKVKMAQGKGTATLHSARPSCSSSENGSACPQLRFTASLLEKGPWGLQAASSRPVSSLGTLPPWPGGRCYFLKTLKYLLCFLPGTSHGASLQTLVCFTLTVSTQLSKGAPASGPLHCSSTPRHRACPSLDSSLCPDATPPQHPTQQQALSHYCLLHPAHFLLPTSHI